MPTIAKWIIFTRVSFVAALVGALMLCENRAHQLVIGGVGIGIIGVSMYLATRHALKIGYDSGFDRAIADMLCEHVRLQENAEIPG